jgi:hypothetical protein
VRCGGRLRRAPIYLAAKSKIGSATPDQAIAREADRLARRSNSPRCSGLAAAVRLKGELNLADIGGEMGRGHTWREHSCAGARGPRRLATATGSCDRRLEQARSTNRYGDEAIAEGTKRGATRGGWRSWERGGLAARYRRDQATRDHSAVRVRTVAGRRLPRSD